MEYRMVDGYRVEALGDGLWGIDDEQQDSAYLIEGRDRALLIDTGMGKNALTPVLRTLTDKPIDLALTHAHVDHMEHADEFKTIYLHCADVAAWRGKLSVLFRMGQHLFRVPRRRLSASRFTPIDETTILDPGGCPIRVLPAPGHTPGSVIYVDDAHRALFTGDAFGSGEAAWMWLPFGAPVSAYRDALNALLPQMERYRAYRFFGGHRLQGRPYSDSPHARTLDLRVAKDMATLCDRMLRGECTGKPVGLLPMLRLRVYAYGHASMVQRRSKIH